MDACTLWLAQVPLHLFVARSAKKMIDTAEDNIGGGVTVLPGTPSQLRARV